jgi:hypothetical protein
LREEFAKACFETLLQFSFFGPKGNPNLFIQPSNGTSNTSGVTQTDAHSVHAEIGLVNRLAVSSLLQRFHDVVCKYVNDEQLSGKCPLPRHRMSEISFVLKALATLISSLKKAPPETGTYCPAFCFSTLIEKTDYHYYYVNDSGSRSLGSSDCIVSTSSRLHYLQVRTSQSIATRSVARIQTVVAAVRLRD